jgi:predicted esterase
MDDGVTPANDMDHEIVLIRTPTHGRVLVRRTERAAAAILGFHGYAENAMLQMQRLEQIRDGSYPLMLVSLQGLHRFYRSRNETVVAGWMTREDREAAIADNITYVDTVARSLGIDATVPLIYAGFSQGVATAFRAAVRGSVKTAAVIAAGGDVPPELLADASLTFPRVLLTRGRTDEWYTQQKFDADAAALRLRGADVDAVTLDGGHEWTADLSVRCRTFIAEVCCASSRGGSPPPRRNATW